MEEGDRKESYPIKVLYVPLGEGIRIPEKCPSRKEDKCLSGIKCPPDNFYDCPIYKRPLKESPRP